MSERERSSRTTKTMWLSPPSLPTRWAKYTPDTASSGIAHDADTDQPPQSTRPVVGWSGHWVCTPAGKPVIAATLRAPSPP